MRPLLALLVCVFSWGMRIVGCAAFYRHHYAAVTTRSIGCGYNALHSSSASSSQPRSSHPWQLSAEVNDGDGSPNNSNTPTRQKSKAQGVYSRPSAAIERGSGFFVPGLEGPKVRLAVGAVLLSLTALNHQFYYSTATAATAASGNTFSEGLAASYSVFVLFQAAVEYSKEVRQSTSIQVGANTENLAVTDAAKSSSLTGTASTTSYQQLWSMQVDPDFRSTVEWAAASYLSLTPATNMILLGPGVVTYWLGSSEPPAPDQITGPTVVEACQSAVDTVLNNSSSGRVSLPATHPAVQGLFPDSASSGDGSRKSAGNTRCVVLQRVSKEKQLCWMMTSNELLAAFTKQDLVWLGQLAKLVDSN